MYLRLQRFVLPCTSADLEYSPQMLHTRLLRIAGEKGSMEHSAARRRVHHRVIEVRDLNEATYVLCFERLGMQFQPGQYISVGPRGDINMREYSIYSPVDSEYLEILVKEVEGGYVSRRLRALRPEDEVYVEGPFGFFLMDEEIRRRRTYMIGTGTGISPFHCFVGSYPGSGLYHSAWCALCC